jgi:hypothetical protein
MESAHFFRSSYFGVIHFEGGGEIIVINKTMDHLDTLWFHRMFFAELIVCYIFVVEVADFAHLQYWQKAIYNNCPV